jgi:hypothetical protein
MLSLCYYELHLYLVHLLATPGVAWFANFSRKVGVRDEQVWLATGLEGYGFSLAVVYPVWMFVVINLLLLCKWYDKF